jgi:N-acetylglucosaminyldiphosphoundecaprenol N-acetyl-beta-D-mannosaminyltransferase
MVIEHYSLVLAQTRPRQTTRQAMRSIQVLGVRVDPLTKVDLIQYIDEAVRSKAHVVVANVNAHALNLAQKDPSFREFLNGSGAVFCDGFGVILGARLLGHRIPERITFADWTWDLAEEAQTRRWRLFLLGARPGVAERAGVALRSRYPALQIVGFQHGYFEKTRGHPENQRVIKMINAAETDVLVVGFGMPSQEFWLRDNWANVRAHVALPAGAALDYVSGRVRRGPLWMTQHGLEWLARLVIEPRRLWRRYLIGNPSFLWRVICERARRPPASPARWRHRR